MRTFQKYLTGVLAASIVLSMTPMLALAAETDAADETETTTVVESTEATTVEGETETTTVEGETETTTVEGETETTTVEGETEATTAEGETEATTEETTEATTEETVVERPEATPVLISPAPSAGEGKVIGTFSDTANHWAKDAIAYTVGKEYFTGTTGDTFSPDASMTRGMLVTVLYRFAGNPTYLEENPFTDVTDTVYYKDSATWAAVNNIIDGSTGTFAAETIVTREDLAVMLFNYAKLLSRDMLIDTGAMYAPSDKIVLRDLNSFSDKDTVSASAYDALAWATAKGVITGKTSNVIAPKASVTRAEMATMLVRFASLT